MTIKPGGKNLEEVLTSVLALSREERLHLFQILANQLDREASLVDEKELTDADLIKQRQMDRACYLRSRYLFALEGFTTTDEELQEMMANPMGIGDLLQLPEAQEKTA